MAILKIARMGHPVLRRRAAPVADPTSPEIRRLVQDMLETMEDAGGTGLAAPQVHVPLRLVVFFVAGRRAAQEDGPPEDGPPEDYSLAGGRRDVPLTVLVNPEIEPLTEADRKSTRLNSSHSCASRMPSSALKKKHKTV